jgi:hypothetical protein
MVVRADDGAIHIMDIPVQVPCGVGLLLARGTEASPDACLAPAVEAAGNGLPGAIPFGDIAPGSAGAEEPEDAVEDAAVVSGWAACMRFCGGSRGCHRSHWVLVRSCLFIPKNIQATTEFANTPQPSGG